MLRWRALYPYNAVHVVRVDGALARAHLHDAIGAELTFSGLTGLRLDRARRRYEYEGGPPKFTLDVIAAGEDAHAALCSEIERQLNLPFPSDGRIDPFRFFVLPQDGTIHLGLAYDHFVAGGDSIAALLNGIVDRYRGVSTHGAPPQLYPPTFAPLFARNAACFVRNLGWLRRAAASCRRGLRPRYDDVGDGYNGFVHVAAEAPATASLLATGRSWKVTFNDVLLAVVLRALAAHAPPRPATGRRRELAVASIVNLRGEMGFDTRAAFGQFLSSMRIAHAVPEGIALERLARDVHAETARIKKDKLFLQTLAAVRVNGVMWKFLDTERRQRLYAKVYPVLAGVSTLNIDALWRAGGASAPPADYLRAVPTGPIAPLVVAATTCADTLQLGFSYRRAAFDREQATRIAATVAASIRELQ
jgi:hypothetical protein